MRNVAVWTFLTLLPLSAQDAKTDPRIDPSGESLVVEACRALWDRRTKRSELSRAAASFFSREGKDGTLKGASLEALRQYSQKPWLRDPDTLTAADHLEAAGFLADRIDALGSSHDKAPVQALQLFALAHLSQTSPGPESEKVARRLGLVFKDGALGSVEGHSVMDLNYWISGGDYDLAEAACRIEYRGVDSLIVRFVRSWGLVRWAVVK